MSAYFFMLGSSSELQNRESQDVHTKKKKRDDKDYVFFNLDFIVTSKWIPDMLDEPKPLATQTTSERPGGIQMEWYVLCIFTEKLPEPQRI